MFQVVRETQEHGEWSDWIITDIYKDAETSEIVVELADPQFIGRREVPLSVVTSPSFTPLEAVDGTPVWGY